MLMRWFNKPEGDVLRWELSRRVRGVGGVRYHAAEWVGRMGAKAVIGWGDVENSPYDASRVCRRLFMYVAPRTRN